MALPFVASLVKGCLRNETNFILAKSSVNMPFKTFDPRDINKEERPGQAKKKSPINDPGF